MGKYCRATKSRAENKANTAKHQRKYDLTFLKPLRSGIVRATRSLHKLAESTNSNHNHWTFSLCCKMFLWGFIANEKPISRNSIENLIGGSNLNWNLFCDWRSLLIFSANQISETKLDNKIESLEKTRPKLTKWNFVRPKLVFYWKFNYMNLNQSMQGYNLALFLQMWITKSEAITFRSPRTISDMTFTRHLGISLASTSTHEVFLAQ